MGKTASGTVTVDGIIASLPARQQAIAKALRQIIRKAAPQLQETIKWEYPCYCSPGNVCSIMDFTNHVNLAFYRGAELSDEKGLLGGTGKGMRHVTIRSAKDIRKGAIAALVKQAARLGK